MKVIVYSRNFYGRKVYDTELTDIRDVAAEFGCADDSLTLCDDDFTPVSRAVWPQGSKCYMFAYGDNFDVNPEFCNYIY